MNEPSRMSSTVSRKARPGKGMWSRVHCPMTWKACICLSSHSFSHSTAYWVRSAVGFSTRKALRMTSGGTLPVSSTMSSGSRRPSSNILPNMPISVKSTGVAMVTSEATGRSG